MRISFDLEQYIYKNYPEKLQDEDSSLIIELLNNCFKIGITRTEFKHLHKLLLENALNEFHPYHIEGGRSILNYTDCYIATQENPHSPQYNRIENPYEIIKRIEDQLNQAVAFLDFTIAIIMNSKEFKTNRDKCLLEYSDTESETIGDRLLELYTCMYCAYRTK